MNELTYEELKEFALALNELSAKRNQYLLDESNIKYRDENKKFLELDKSLLQKVKERIDILKGKDICQ
jgi:hypothetical protein